MKADEKKPLKKEGQTHKFFLLIAHSSQLVVVVVVVVQRWQMSNWEKFRVHTGHST